MATDMDTQEAGRGRAGESRGSNRMRLRTLSQRSLDVWTWWTWLNWTLLLDSLPMVDMTDMVDIMNVEYQFNMKDMVGMLGMESLVGVMYIFDPLTT